MIMVCIALMTSDVEDLLMHLLVICLPLEKCFFSYSGNFFSIDLCEFCKKKVCFSLYIPGAWSGERELNKYSRVFIKLNYHFKGMTTERK